MLRWEKFSVNNSLDEKSLWVYFVLMYIIMYVYILIVQLHPEYDSQLKMYRYVDINWSNFCNKRSLIKRFVLILLANLFISRVQLKKHSWCFDARGTTCPSRCVAIFIRRRAFGTKRLKVCEIMDGPLYCTGTSSRKPDATKDNCFIA